MQSTRLDNLKSHAPAVELVWTPTGWQWLPVALGIVVLYELLRLLVVGSIKRRYEAHVERFLRDHEIPHDPFRHTHRVVIKQRVLDDPGLQTAIQERADAEARTYHAVESDVEAWLDEIVPRFNILAYYKVGYRIGRIVAYAAYNVRLDKDSLELAQAAIPEGAAVVYVSNHRSNADFVVTGFMLSRSVQISYAVGEWARVWPLESLFKAFGSYFVRRGEKDELYHRTLQAYLQLVTKQGVTQAMFPEGGLSRDGSLRPVKLGLLDHMATCKLDPAFDKPLVFVPVGINFDRVIEDETLVREARGEPRVRRSLPVKLGRLIIGTPRLIVNGIINTGRFLAKRLKKHGVAAIHFGQPIVFDDWAREHPDVVAEPDRRQRHAALQPFGQSLMDAIGHSIPVTPATLLCGAAAAIGEERMRAGVDRGRLIMAVREVFERLKAAGAPMAISDPYDADQPFRRATAAELSHDIDEAEALDRAIGLALDVTSKRRILYKDGDLYRSQRFELVRYYANSLGAHLAPGTQPQKSGHEHDDLEARRVV